MYNVGGNIVSKTEYVYTTGELGEPTKTYSYSYDGIYLDIAGALLGAGGKALWEDGGIHFKVDPLGWFVSPEIGFGLATLVQDLINFFSTN